MNQNGQRKSKELNFIMAKINCKILSIKISNNKARLFVSTPTDILLRFSQELK